jgi:hypothetical protein
METILRISSIVLACYFLAASFRKPITLFFLDVVLESYFFGTIDVYYQYNIKLMPGVTLYTFDITKIAMLILVIIHWERKSTYIYKRALSIFAIFISFFLFLKISVPYGVLDLNQFKNFLRVMILVIYPLFLMTYYNNDSKKHFRTCVHLIVIFVLVSFFLEYFGSFIKIYNKYNLTYNLEQTIANVTLKRVTIEGQPVMALAPLLYLVWYFQEKKITHFIACGIILFVYFLAGFRGAFISQMLGVVILFFMLTQSSEREKIKFLIISIVGFYFLMTAAEFLKIEFFGLNTRFNDTINEILYTKGTGGERIIKTLTILDYSHNKSGIYLLGTQMTTNYQTVDLIIANDLGILTSIVNYGLIFMIGFTIYTFRIIKDTIRIKNTTNNNYAMATLALFYASVPALIFLMEPVQFVLSNILVLYGLMLGEYKYVDQGDIDIKRFRAERNIFKNDFSQRV